MTRKYMIVGFPVLHHFCVLLCLLWVFVLLTSRKHAYSNVLKISSQKIEIFQIKKQHIFHVSAQNIDCEYSLKPPQRGGSNEYPQFMFSSKNKKK